MILTQWPDSDKLGNAYPGPYKRMLVAGVRQNNYELIRLEEHILEKPISISIALEPVGISAENKGRKQNGPL